MMSAMSRKDYLAVARAVRDSQAVYDSKRKITDALIATFRSEDESFARHIEVFEAIALSPERSA